MRNQMKSSAVFLTVALTVVACSENKQVTSTGERFPVAETPKPSPAQPTTSAASVEIPDLNQAIAHTKTGNHHFRIARVEGNSPAMHVEGDVTRNGTDHRMHYTVIGASEPGDNGEWITMESKVFHKPEPGKPWEEVNNAAVRSLIESAIFVKQEDMDEAKHTGTEKLNGQDTHHFTCNGTFATNPAKYDFWTDQENVLKCEVKSDNNVTYTTTFDKFGVVGEIKKPV